MKKLIYITISAVLALGLFSACAEKEVVEKTDGITITDSKLTIPAKGGEATINVEATGELKIELDKTWCTYTISNGDNVKFMAGENMDIESRYAKATLTCGKKTVELSIVQLGYKTTTFEPEDIVSTCVESSFVFPYTYDEQISATTEQDWIHLTIKADTLVVSLDENTTQGTLEDRARYGDVKWKLGPENGIISVRQNHISFMKADDNWEVSYAGSGVYEETGETIDYLRNEVTDPAISGKYAITYATKAEVEESGMLIEDYITDVVAPNLKSNFDLVIMIAQIFGIQMTYDDLLYAETHDEIFDPFAKGEYYAFAVGFDSENCDLTGHYQVAPFTIRGGGDRPSTGYESWLGDWTVTRGSYTDTWTVSKKVAGESYTISGIEANPQGISAIEAKYDKDQDAMVLYGIPYVATIDTGTYGKVDVGLFGKIYDEADQKEYIITFGEEPYSIFTAKHDTYETATLHPTTITIEGGEQYTFVKYGFMGKITEGEYAGYYLSLNTEQNTLPNTITSTGGGGGGGGTEGWAGNWTISRGGSNDTWTIAEKSASVYTIAGIEADPASIGALDAEYDSSNGTITMNSLTGLKTVSTQYGTANIGVLGEFIDESDGELYILTLDETYPIFIGSLNGNGSASLNPATIQFQDGTEVTFVDFGFFGELIDGEYEGYYLSFSEELTELPNTLSQSSASSMLIRASHSNGTYKLMSTSNVRKVNGKEYKVIRKDLISNSTYKAESYVPYLPIRYRKLIKNL